MKAQLALVAVPLAVALSGIASAQTIVYDFDAGVGPEWELSNTGSLWNIGVSGPDLSIAKVADPLAERPQGFIEGGIRSKFELIGDFEITVDFSLTTLAADPNAPMGLSESVLSVDDGLGGSFSVLRFVLPGFGDYIEAYSASTGPIGAIAAPASILTGGRYRIARTGSTISGSWAPPGSSSFQSFGSATGPSEPMRIALLGIQGANALASNRSSNAVDIGFDNLVINGATAVSNEASSWGHLKAAFAEE